MDNSYFYKGFWETWEPTPKGGTYASDMEKAYEAGWNACRDKWGGMTYEETLEYEKYE